MESFNQGRGTVSWSWLLLGIESVIVRCGMRSFPMSSVLKFKGGVEMGDGSNDSGDWGLYLLSCWVGFCWTTVIAARSSKGFGGRLRSFRIGGTIGCCALNPCGNVGSLESSSRVTISGSGDATEEIVGNSLVWVPDSSVKIEILGSCFVVGLDHSRVAPRILNWSPLNPLRMWRPT